MNQSYLGLHRKSKSRKFQSRKFQEARYTGRGHITTIHHLNTSLSIQQYNGTQCASQEEEIHSARGKWKSDTIWQSKQLQMAVGVRELRNTIPFSSFHSPPSSARINLHQDCLPKVGGRGSRGQCWLVPCKQHVTIAVSETWWTV